MVRTLRALILVVVLAVGLVPAVVGRGGPDEVVTGRALDAHGRLSAEWGYRADEDSIAFHRVFHYARDAPASDPALADNDCQSTASRKAGWKWSGAFGAYASDHADLFTLAGGAWDAETSAGIFAGVTAGVAGVAGQRDGVNQIAWAGLGSSGTIAVTTTWYNRFTKLAVESDQQYNTFYPWNTTGDPASMDVLNIAVHEIGHSLGLSHPKGNAASIGCLTMYAYADYGETQKRSLGVGDILGIRAVYGA